jgi:hypothetical protein
MNFEPFQRTDISMQPLGPTNCIGSNRQSADLNYQIESFVHRAIFLIDFIPCQYEGSLFPAFPLFSFYLLT